MNKMYMTHAPFAPCLCTSLHSCVAVWPVFVLKVCLLTSRHEHINNIILSFHSLLCNVDQSPVFNSKLNSYPFSDFDILATDFKYLLSFFPQYWIESFFLSCLDQCIKVTSQSCFFFFWRYRASWKRRVIIKVLKAAHKAWYHSVSVITQAREILTCLLTFTYRYFLLLIFPNSLIVFPLFFFCEFNL